MKYYNAESYEVDRFNAAILKYQVMRHEGQGRGARGRAPSLGGALGRRPETRTRPMSRGPRPPCGEQWELGRGL